MSSGPLARMLPSVLLWVAYDGTEFAGYQVQPGQRTVEGLLTEAVSAMNGARLRLRGASRTDAGVHALAQAVAFDPTRDIDAKGWVRGLNERLPDAIRVRAVEFVAAGFEPRHSATHKEYRYVVSLGSVVDPLDRHRVFHIDQRRARPWDGTRNPRDPTEWLDLDAMDAAATSLQGRHDFAAFQASNDPREETVREVLSVSVGRSFRGDPMLVAIDVVGTAFLKNMVRIIAGTLLEVGRGRMNRRGVEEALRSRDRRCAGPTAPARGLTLVRVHLAGVP